MEDNKQGEAGRFERFSNPLTRYTGSYTAFMIAFALILGWSILRSLFHYSESWQLVIHTGRTIITFLMVFLIQKSQNKESMAVQLQLNELLAANMHTSNRMVSIEDLLGRGVLQAAGIILSVGRVGQTGQ